MDQMLIEYINSGKAWLLVGSGPSIEMGYPTWEQLASIATGAAKAEHAEADTRKLDSALSKRDFPSVFEEAKTILGGPRLLQILSDNLRPALPSKIYHWLARWPIPVYLTTNYDDELQRKLANLQLSYMAYSNCADHMSQLVPDFSGIVKLHGDLRTEDGLILTASQYKAIDEAPDWEYWRSKMTAVFQMNRVIVIGQSLSDRNIKHVLQAAKKGSGVTQPVIWIAPNVPMKDRKELLENYRIRVVPYDDTDGRQKNLARLIECLNDFIPPRPVIRVQEQIEKVSLLSNKPNAAAPGFFVFNEVCKKGDFGERRIDIILSAMESALAEINDLGGFRLVDAFKLAGWPDAVKLDGNFMSQISDEAVKRGLFSRLNDQYQIMENALTIAAQKRKGFEHMRGRFQNSLVLRTKREFPDLNDSQVSLLSSDIESCLSAYFKEGGLTLASLVFSGGAARTVPVSIVPFITAASTRYDNLTMRQAFFKASIDLFLHPESAEREYLGRICQGFFAFHGLGVFGDAAIERLLLAKDTVWLLDSDTQIRALALGSSVNMMYREILSRLKSMGVRLFTTSNLLEEAREHLWFANNVIKENGPSSSYVFAAARGEAPFRKSNSFLEGFIRWIDAGNRSNWQSYLYEVFGSTDYSDVDMKKALDKIGLEVIDLREWPGFDVSHYYDVEEHTKKIADIWEQAQRKLIAADSESPVDPQKKAKPEAEAYNIIKRERAGEYHIISEPGAGSSAWFVSYTSIINALEANRNVTITWQPDAFLSFASTLCDIIEPHLAEQAFERILLGIAQSGLSLLDDDTIARVFGTVIDQSRIKIEEVRREYSHILQIKYGESLESVLARVSPPNIPIVAVQIATQIAQEEAELRRIAERSTRIATERAERSEKELEKLQKYKTKWLQKQNKNKSQKRKQKHKKK